MDMPETRFARSGDVDIAYQVVGDGPIDVVQIGTLWWHLEYQWTDPGITRWISRLASFARFIMFDPRGTGMSDRVSDSCSFLELSQISSRGQALNSRTEASTR
jgi:pimeloyl-ACP methyl ester carboxylesterase